MTVNAITAEGLVKVYKSRKSEVRALDGFDLEVPQGTVVGLLRDEDLPREEIELLGPTGAKRIDRLVHDLVETSAAAGDIRQSEEVGAAMHRLRDFMFERVYLAEHAMEEHRRAHETIDRIVDHLAGQGEPADEITAYVAGMTDRFALTYAESL